MSLSVELKFQGDITTPEHQAAIKLIMDAVEQTVKELPGIGYFKASRMETKSTAATRMLTEDGLVNPEPFPLPTGFMHEAKMQFGFHLNPATKSPDKPDIG